MSRKETAAPALSARTAGDRCCVLLLAYWPGATDPAPEPPAGADGAEGADGADGAALWTPLTAELAPEPADDAAELAAFVALDPDESPEPELEEPESPEPDEPEPDEPDSEPEPLDEPEPDESLDEAPLPFVAPDESPEDEPSPCDESIEPDEPEPLSTDAALVSADDESPVEPEL